MREMCHYIVINLIQYIIDALKCASCTPTIKIQLRLTLFNCISAKMGLLDVYHCYGQHKMLINLSSIHYITLKAVLFCLLWAVLFTSLTYYSVCSSSEKVYELTDHPGYSKWQVPELPYNQEVA